MKTLDERDPENFLILRVTEARDGAHLRGMSQARVARHLFCISVHILHFACGRSNTLELLRGAARDVENGTVQADHERDRFRLRSSANSPDDDPRPQADGLFDDVETKAYEIAEELKANPDAWRSGHAARSFWKFVAHTMTEAISVASSADKVHRQGEAGDRISQTLKEAEEEIERGVLKLALLIAAPEMHDRLRTKFQAMGLTNPYHSSLGFWIGKRPKLLRKVNRFVAAQMQKGKPLARVKREARKFMKQLYEQG